MDLRGGSHVIPALLGASFEPPSTTDFVYGCMGPGIPDLRLHLLLQLHPAPADLDDADRARRCSTSRSARPTVVPGKLQMLMEIGVDFVRENVAVPMLGPAADKYLPLLASFFFFILIGNLFEVVPGFSFSANSRVAIPLVLGHDLVGDVQRGRDPQARVPRLPEAHVHHRCGAGLAPVLAVDADRVRVEHHRATDHADRPSRGQLPGGALPPGDLLPGDGVLPGERTRRPGPSR